MADFRVKQGVPLSSYTTFKIGGPAKYFAIATDEDSVRALVQEAKNRALPLIVIGGGSNVLVSDEGIEGFVMKNEIGGIVYNDSGNDTLVTAGAGVVWDDLVAATIARGLWGLENLSAIPGATGATPIQNVGAYGVEAGDLIETVRVFDMGKEEYYELSASDCHFGYRDSFFKTPEGRGYIVTAVTYRLSKMPRPKLEYKDLAARFGGEAEPALADIRQAVIEIRAGKFPDLATVGTAGSFFKNPIVSREQYERLQGMYPELPGFPQTDGRIKIPLGWILDKVCGLRGVREDAVGTYENQSLVLVNYGGASARNVTTFAQKISDRVFDKTSVSIEWEVNRI